MKEKENLRILEFKNFVAVAVNQKLIKLIFPAFASSQCKEKNFRLDNVLSKSKYRLIVVLIEKFIFDVFFYRLKFG